MRRSLLILLLALITAITGLTACTPKNKEGSAPAVLQGQSEHWKVKLEYIANGKELQEVTTVQTTITQQTISEATVTIVRKDQEPVSYPVVEPEYFKTGQPLTFTDKPAVKNWTDTEQVEIEWKIGDRRYKEYVPVENKAGDAAK